MKQYLIFILLILVMGFASAAPPFVSTTTSNGLTIDTLIYGTLKQNSDFTLHIHVYNSSNGLNQSNSTTKCNVHLYNSTGNHILRQDNMGYDGKGDWEIIINKGNFTGTGQYALEVWCNNANMGGSERLYFDVTTTGNSYDTPTAITYSLLFGIMLFIFLLAGYATVAIPGENIRNKDGQIIQINYKKYFKWLTFVVTYISFVSMTYFAWNMSYAFIAFDSLARYFKWVFFISFGLMWPVLLVSVIYIISKWLMESKINEMLERGLTPRRV